MEPVIQWVGGKKRLLNTIKFLMPKEYNDYHEIFLGGGCLLLNLQPKSSYSIEKNINIFKIYDNIKKFSEEIIEILKIIEKNYLDIDKEDKDNRKKFYFEKRKEYNDLSYDTNENSIKKTTLLLFLNKTCFNAVFRENRKGMYNVPFGNGKNCKICCEDRIRNLHTFLNKEETHLFNEDFEKCKEYIKKGDFIYIDPPYYPLNSNSFTNYDASGFNEGDHERLIELIKDLDKKGVNIMLSNSNNQYFQTELNHLKKFDISLARTLNCNTEGRKVSKCEMIMTNYLINNIIEVKTKSENYELLQEGDIVTKKIRSKNLYLMVDEIEIGKVDDKIKNLLNDNIFIMKINEKKSDNMVEILIKF